MKRLCMPLVVLAASTVLLSPAWSSADVTHSDYTQGGGFHEFRDELVGSDVIGPKGGSIRVRPQAYRCLLIRPRGSFVWEMYKSVEQL